MWSTYSSFWQIIYQEGERYKFRFLFSTLSKYWSYENEKFKKTCSKSAWQFLFDININNKLETKGNSKGPWSVTTPNLTSSLLLELSAIMNAILYAFYTLHFGFWEIKESWKMIFENFVSDKNILPKFSSPTISGFERTKISYTKYL